MYGPVERIDPLTAEVPVSAGVPVGVRFALGAGIFVVIFIMCLTAGSSMVGHIWPWADAMQYKLGQ